MTPPSFPAARISPNRYHRFVTNRTAVKTVVSLRCQNFCRPRLGAATIRARGWAAPRGETASVSLLTNSHGVQQVRTRYPPKRTASPGRVSLVRGFMTFTRIWDKAFRHLPSRMSPDRIFRADIRMEPFHADNAIRFWDRIELAKHRARPPCK